MTSDDLPQARFVRAGDSALVVELEERIDPEVNARCIAIADEMHECGVHGIRDVVPAYRSVTVYFDPLKTDQRRLIDALKQATRKRPPAVGTAGQKHLVPVCYGGEFGPDLSEVAALAGLSCDETIALHAAPDYRVFMVGFIPGFAYLGLVDVRIAAARRDTPRTRVPAGTVALASGQTGVYPIESPGGWQLIGRTPLRMFDPDRTRPSLFQPGDFVHFFPIGRHEWDRYGL